MESSGTLENTTLAASCFCRADGHKLQSGALVHAAVNRQEKKPTQELSHDGVGLLQGLSSMGGVKQQPINDVDLPQVLLRAQSQLAVEQRLVEDFPCRHHFAVVVHFHHLCGS